MASHITRNKLFHSLCFLPSLVFLLFREHIKQASTSHPLYLLSHRPGKFYPNDCLAQSCMISSTNSKPAISSWKPSLITPSSPTPPPLYHLSAFVLFFIGLGTFDIFFLMYLLSAAFRDIKGKFQAKMGSIKDRNGMDLTDAEDIKKRWQE